MSNEKGVAQKKKCRCPSEPPCDSRGRNLFFPLREDSQQCNYRMCERELCFPAKWTHDVLEQEFSKLFIPPARRAYVETRQNTKNILRIARGLRGRPLDHNLSFLSFFFLLPAGTPAADSRRKRVSPVQPRLWSRITISTWKEDNQEFKERK